MELTRNHRESLLVQLEKAQEELHVQIRIRNNAETDGVAAMGEIGEYLAKKRIDLIKKALTDNEIDY